MRNYTERQSESRKQKDSVFAEGGGFLQKTAVFCGRVEQKILSYRLSIKKTARIMFDKICAIC